MQLIEGYSIVDFLNKRKKPFTEPDALEIIWQLLTINSGLHSRNIYHGDIKPENIILEKANDVKIVDYGFSIRSDNGMG
jgi:serine/threonine protein kinase